MQDIRYHKESFFHSRFWIVVLIIFLCITAFSTFKMYRKYIHAKNVRNEYATELSTIQKHQDDLQKNIDALSTDRGKESEIRDRYRVVKDGEQMILIIDNKKEESVASLPTTEIHRNFLVKFIDFFKK